MVATTNKQTCRPIAFDGVKEQNLDELYDEVIAELLDVFVSPSAVKF